jgi:hypothetical protein
MKYGKPYLPEFFQSKMKICLFNSIGNIPDVDFDKTIWCPLSKDIVHIVQFFREYHQENILFIESVFKTYLSDLVQVDTVYIIFFDSEKKKQLQESRVIAFYSQSDTLANNTLCIISGNPAFRYANFIPSGKTENSEKFFRDKNLPFKKYSFRALRKLKPSVLVLYNDWTKAAIRIIAHCRFLKIPVVCIQESIIDFGDSFHRMQNADNLMIQGVRTVIELPRIHFYLTGNPRYSRPEIKVHSGEYALINCNFTYNIYEKIRYKWLDDITATLDELGIPYLISQHPRDNGDLRKYRNHIRSSSSTLNKQLEGAGLVITRFSSLIHESLIEGVPVIYYNPHNEAMKYDFDFNSEFLFSAQDKETLKEYSALLYKKEIWSDKLDYYLNLHCLPVNTYPVASINHLLSVNNFKIQKFSLSDFLHILLYQPIFVNTVQKVRQLLNGKSKFIN